MPTRYRENTMRVATNTRRAHREDNVVSLNRRRPVPTTPGGYLLSVHDGDRVEFLVTAKNTSSLTRSRRYRINAIRGGPGRA
jgi:hypothetical protein